MSTIVPRSLGPMAGSSWELADGVIAAQKFVRGDSLQAGLRLARNILVASRHGFTKAWFHSQHDVAITSQIISHARAWQPVSC
jgi:hypothetical protein